MTIHNSDSIGNQPVFVPVPEFIWDGSDVAIYPSVLQRGQVVAPIRLYAEQDPNHHLPALVTGDDVLFTIEAGSFPPGITLKKQGPFWFISGMADVLPKGITRYQAVIRITPIPEYTSSDPAIAEEQISERTIEFRVYPVNEGHTWDPSWLSGLGTEVLSTGQTVYTLGSLTRGAATNIQLKLINPDNDKLTFTVVTAGPDFEPKPTFMPTGLSIDKLYRVIGVPNSTNPEGDYYFKIRVTDGENSGNPATDSDDFVFKFSVDGQVAVDPQPSDEVDWNTDSFLGSTYENYPSHFVVQASNPSGLQVSYDLAPGSNPLPEGIGLDSQTGMLIGILPFVSGTTTYKFTVRAFIGNSYTDKEFSFTVLDLYKSSGILNVWATVNEWDRSEIAKWMWAVQLIGESKYFRFTDPNFGRIRQPKMYLVNGLNPTTSEEFSKQLRDYHRTMLLRFGELRTAKAYDPSGRYIYDIIYFHIQDPQEGAGGFDSFNREQKVTYPHGTLPSIPLWNLVAGQNNDRYHPNSILNARNDLIQKVSAAEPAQRIDWLPYDQTLYSEFPPGSPENPNNLPPPPEEWQTDQHAGQRGIGLSGKEGMPLWMSCRQIPNDPLSVLGFQPSVELAYVKPGLGPSILNILRNAGFEKQFNGKDLTVDRYLLASIGSITTTFDEGLVYDYELQYTGTTGQTNIQIHADVLQNIRGVQLNYTDLPPTDYSVSGDFLNLTTPLQDGDLVIVQLKSNGLETTFDGPGLATLPTPDVTTFDLIVLPTSGKYYKFPPGDKKAG